MRKTRKTVKIQGRCQSFNRIIYTLVSNGIRIPLNVNELEDRLVFENNYTSIVVRFRQIPFLGRTVVDPRFIDVTLVHDGEEPQTRSFLVLPFPEGFNWI